MTTDPAPAAVPAAMLVDPATLDGLVPPHLAASRFRIFLEEYELPVDIGFHDFEVGTPQRLLVSVEVQVEAGHFASEDLAAAAWNYDFLRTEIRRLALSRRFNLQETLVRAIYELIAARIGVTAVKVSSRKPDIYPDCKGVGVEISSF